MSEQGAGATSTAEVRSPQGALWVFLEHDGQTLSPVTNELLGKASELARTAKIAMVGVLIGHRSEPLAVEAARHGVDGLVVLDHPLLEAFSPELYTEVVAEVAAARKPAALLLGATPAGRDLAGRLAVKLKTGLTADCTDLSVDQQGLLVGEVAGFGGGVLATILCRDRRPQMATVRPGVFPPYDPAGESPGFRIERWPVAATLGAQAALLRRAEVVEKHQRSSRDLTKAPVLVIAGRGVNGQLEPLERLASLLGGEVGATRVAVDHGWAQREVQIGQTGLSARPKVALVLGASGAFQFTVGIQGAHTIIAVNTDKEAPVFACSDYCVVADAVTLAEALVEELQSMVAPRPSPATGLEASP